MKATHERRIPDQPRAGRPLCRWREREGEGVWVFGRAQKPLDLIGPHNAALPPLGLLGPLGPCPCRLQLPRAPGRGTDATPLTRPTPSHPPHLHNTPLTPTAPRKNSAKKTCGRHTGATQGIAQVRFRDQRRSLRSVLQRKQRSGPQIGRGYAWTAWKAWNWPQAGSVNMAKKEQVTRNSGSDLGHRATALSAALQIRVYWGLCKRGSGPVGEKRSRSAGDVRPSRVGVYKTRTHK